MIFQSIPDCLFWHLLHFAQPYGHSALLIGLICSHFSAVSSPAALMSWLLDILDPGLLSLWGLVTLSDFGTKNVVFLNHPIYCLWWIFPTTFPLMSLQTKTLMKILCWTKFNLCHYIAMMISNAPLLKTWNLLHSNGFGTLWGVVYLPAHLFWYSKLMDHWTPTGTVEKWYYTTATPGKKSLLHAEYVLPLVGSLEPAFVEPPAEAMVFFEQ